MLTGLHVLLTYQCLYECDHCFLYCGPRAEGTFTFDGIRAAIGQAADAEVEWIYLEGGEPFLYYPLLVEAVRLTRARGMRAGIVTNGYWAVSEADAELWLRPFADLGLDDLSVSEDTFHSDQPERSPARTAWRVAQRLGLPAGRICIEGPTVTVAGASSPEQNEGTADEASTGGASATEGGGRAGPVSGRHGEPIVGGDVTFRGRAVETLLDGLPRRPYACFHDCTDEDLAVPERVHLDPFGHVFVCQGLSIGNIRERSLREIMAAYRPEQHPIVGPLLRGGPAELARTYGLPEGEEYVSACHLCYLVRRGLLDRFPEHLTPRQVYGVKPPPVC